MSYNTDTLKTAAECDQALAYAANLKDDLVFKQLVQKRSFGDKSESTALAAANLLTVNAQMIGMQAGLEAMPEGPGKVKMVSELRRLNDRRENLEETVQKSGNASLMNLELTNSLLTIQVSEIDLYTAAVEDRKKAF